MLKSANEHSYVCADLASDGSAGAWPVAFRNGRYDEPLARVIHLTHRRRHFLLGN